MMAMGMPIIEAILQRYKYTIAGLSGVGRLAQNMVLGSGGGLQKPKPFFWGGEDRVTFLGVLPQRFSGSASIMPLTGRGQKRFPPGRDRLASRFRFTHP
jgi:hypothetical protein